MTHAHITPGSDRVSAATYSIHTEALYTYDRVLLTTHKNALGFSVRACMDAHLALLATPSMPTDHALELVIGAYGNKKSFFRANGTVLQVVDTPNALDCECHRHYWVALQRGMMKFGIGDPYDKVLMEQSWNGGFYSVALSTTVGVVGNWEIYKDSGKVGVSQTSFLSPILCQYYYYNLYLISVVQKQT